MVLLLGRTDPPDGKLLAVCTRSGYCTSEHYNYKRQEDNRHTCYTRITKTEKEHTNGKLSNYISMKRNKHPYNLQIIKSVEEQNRKNQPNTHTNYILYILHNNVNILIIKYYLIHIFCYNL